jgi:hypothetical protein
LPLPAETGRAIAAYLRTERPTTANRAVFVRHIAPYDEPIGAAVVRNVIIAAFRRCTVLPVDIFQTQPRDLADSQAKVDEATRNRVGALAGWGRLIKRSK